MLMSYISKLKLDSYFCVSNPPPLSPQLNFFIFISIILIKFTNLHSIYNNMTMQV